MTAAPSRRRAARRPRRYADHGGLVGRPGPGAFVDELGPEADVVVVELLVVAELRHAHALRQHVGDARSRAMSSSKRHGKVLRKKSRGGPSGISSSWGQSRGWRRSLTNERVSAVRVSGTSALHSPAVAGEPQA